MWGIREARPSRGVTVVVLVVLVLLSGCQGLVGGVSTPTATAASPTEGGTPHTTTPPTETATPTARPDISPRRVAELTRFTKRVNLDTPTTGEWEFLGPETVRYRTTPDFDIRDEYGPGAEPPPEAIAREMVDASDLAPETAIVEVVSTEGEYLGEFNVTESMAQGLENYSLEPMDFVNRTYRTGNFTDEYTARGDASVKTLYIDNTELRKAYVERTLEWLSENASGAADNLVDAGLYNESFPIPQQDIAIKDGSTIYFTLQVPPEEASRNLVELHQAWPSLYKSRYYDRRSMDITLQVRIYNKSNLKFEFAQNYISPFVNSYINGRISKRSYDYYIIKYSVGDAGDLPGVPRNVTKLVS
jgi:hypothetical protein